MILKKTRRISHCRACKEPLYQMINIGGSEYPASQCLNKDCRNYGKPQSFKKGLLSGYSNTHPRKEKIMNNTCLNCTYAKWKRTTSGRLHPSQQGQCTYPVKIVIPKAYYFTGSLAPSGGYISGEHPSTDCPTFLEGKYPVL